MKPMAVEGRRRAPHALLAAALLSAPVACTADTSADPPMAPATAGSRPAAAPVPPRPTRAAVTLAEVPGWPAELAAADEATVASAGWALQSCLSELNRPPRGPIYIFDGGATEQGFEFRGARASAMGRAGERIWCTYSAANSQASVVPADISDTGPGRPPYVAHRREHIPPEPGLVVAELRLLGPAGTGPYIGYRVED